jgi:hypothetical protein
MNNVNIIPHDAVYVKPTTELLKLINMHQLPWFYVRTSCGYPINYICIISVPKHLIQEE